MAATITVCNPDIPASQFPEVELDDGQSRRQYTPSLWGEFFLTHEPCTPSELLSMKEKAEAKKEEVRRIVLDAAASDDLAQKLDLVDVLQRLGVAYHYKEEIDDVLRAVYDDKLGGSDDLYVTSLRFYLLRKHGYAVPSDVFVKFRDEEGNISSNDVNIMMMLYDAAHMRITGEDLLDDIITLNKSRLQYLAETNLETDHVEEVRVTLETPRFRRVERVEARRFISAYEKTVAHDDTILDFAKLDYNIVQALYCQELKQLTIWWKDFKSRTDMRFARDRMVEMYFWMMGLVSEPFYSREQDLYYCLGKVTHVAKSYHAEVKWRDDQYIPTNVEEHLQISMPSIVAMQTANAALVSLGDVTSREAVEWAFNFPKIVRGVAIVARISNDIVSHEREQASDHMASTVQTCMKQYGITAEEATEKLRVHVEKAWMEIVQGCLDQQYSIVLLEKVVNCARTIDFIYKREDAYTSSSKLKDTITSLYVKLV
ncbi:hypothetical protein PR202_ga27769 [Eleusine coracana subsp. coracana]|uniref:Uncharacterized protein n=1 Tax=Eleusine coracana subsp. coracana TaxID=191504 RepID=A0AAV5DGT7_ELECO|nr:hypothetical protein PR202_ga27769 [Eleusine coracana subsp. coracana]